MVILSLYYIAMKYSMKAIQRHLRTGCMDSSLKTSKIFLYLPSDNCFLLHSELILFIFHLQPKHTKTYVNREICWLYIDSTVLRHLIQINSGQDGVNISFPFHSLTSSWRKSLPVGRCWQNTTTGLATKRNNMETESISLSHVRRYFKENKVSILEMCMNTAFILFPSLKTISQKNSISTITSGLQN